MPMLFKNPFDPTVAEQPEKLKTLLKIVSENPHLFNKEALQEFLLIAINRNWMKFVLGASTVDFSLLKLLSEYPDWIDQEALQAVFLDEIFEKQNALQHFASCRPERLEILLKFMSEYSHLFEKETIKQLFFREDGYKTFSALQSAAFYQPKGLKLLLNFLKEHPEVIEDQDLQEILLQKTESGNLLELAVRCSKGYSRHAEHLNSYEDPEDLEHNFKGLYALLRFFDEQSERINQSTIQQLFHPVEDLFERIALKPDGLETVIKLLSEHPDWIDKKDLQRMFLKKGILNATAYSLCNPPETTKKFVELIIQQASFDQKTLGHIFSRKDPDLNIFIIEKVLKKYLEELEVREENNITHTTRLFNHNFGYSTQQKKTAALALEKLFNEHDLFNSENLLALRQSYPALSNGRLGQLFSYCESTTQLTHVREDNDSEDNDIEIRNFSMT